MKNSFKKKKRVFTKRDTIDRVESIDVEGEPGDENDENARHVDLRYEIANLTTKPKVANKCRVIHFNSN